jgi:hypothetical protein
MTSIERPLTLHATRADVHFASPVPVVWSALSGPVKRIRLDFTEDPAHRTAPRIRAGLDDVRSLRAADLFGEEIGRGIAPQDSPGIELGIVDPQRRAVPIACAGAAARSLAGGLATVGSSRRPGWRATLEHPTGVNLAAAPMPRPIFENRPYIHVPSAYDPRIERKLGRAGRIPDRWRAEPWRTTTGPVPVSTGASNVKRP